MPSEGFWHDKYERKDDGLPMPVPHEKPWKNQDLFVKALTLVESKIPYDPMHAYMGFSECRICNCINGSREYVLDDWLWPEGFRHYVEKHNVIPSKEFIDFIIKKSQ